MQHKIVHRNIGPREAQFCDRPIWAWAYLGRNPDFRNCLAQLPSVRPKPFSRHSRMSIIELPAHAQIPEEWGCTFASNSDLSYLGAHVFWDAAVDPGVLPVSLRKARSWPGASADVIDFTKFDADVAVLRLESGHEYVRIVQWPYTIQLAIVDGSALDGPVTVVSHINGYSGRLQALTHARFSAFCRLGKFPRSLFMRKDKKRTEFWRLGLELIDMQRRDIPDINIARILFPKGKDEGDWRRSRVSRLAKAARQFSQGGHLKILRSGEALNVRRSKIRSRSLSSPPLYQ